MKDFIKGIRWLFSIPFILALFIIVITGIASISISNTITNSSNLKRWLKKGEVYNNVSVLLPKVIVSQADNKELRQIPLDENDLIQITTVVLEPSWIKKNIEKIIDSGYLFLEGKTKIPTFTIDISTRKNILVNEITSQLNNQRSPEMAQQLKHELEKNELLNQDRIYSAEFIKINSKEANKIQTVYRHLQSLPLYVIAAFLLISLILFLIVPHKKIRLLGFVCALPSLILIAVAPFAQSIIQTLYVTKVQEAAVNNSALILKIINKPINLAIGDLTSKIIIYGITLTILSALLIFTSFKTKTHKHK